MNEYEALGASGYLGDLRDVAFTWRPYRQWSKSWDHDHCEGCNTGFSEDHEGDLREGWTTTAEYEQGAEYCWVCAACFGEFKDRLGWRAVEDSRPVRPRGTPLDDGLDPHQSMTKKPRLHDEG